MATDRNTLLAETACYSCTSAGVVKVLELGLLRQILLALDPMADTSVNTLLASVPCYACLPAGQQALIGLALLKQIVDTGGGGGVEYGIVDPVAAPPGNSGMFYNTTSGAVWVWNPTTASWDQIIA